MRGMTNTASNTSSPEPEPTADSQHQGASADRDNSHVRRQRLHAALQDAEAQTTLVGALFPDPLPRLHVLGMPPLEGTFIDDERTHRQTDVALWARLSGHDVIVYVVFEYESSDPMMALHMANYQLRIWERYIEVHPTATKVPTILPAVIYQGAEPWTAPTKLSDLVGSGAEIAAELAKYLPSLPYRVVDLTHAGIDGLPGVPPWDLGRR